MVRIIPYYLSHYVERSTPRMPIHILSLVFPPCVSVWALVLGGLPLRFPSIVCASFCILFLRLFPFFKVFFRFLFFVCFVLLPVSCLVILPFDVFRLLVCLCCASRVQYDGMASRCLICLRVLHDGVSLLCQSW